MENENQEKDDENLSFLYNLKAKPQKSDYLYLTHSELDEIPSENKSEKKKNEENYINNNSMNDLSSIQDDEYSDDISIYDYFQHNNYNFYNEINKEKQNELPFEKILEECKYLFNIFEKIKEIFDYKNIIIRCFHDEENKNQENNNCNCIPIIYKFRYGMVFSCDNKNYKYLGICDILKVIFQKKLFIKIDDIKENSDKINNINENTIKIKLIKVIREGHKEVLKLSQNYFAKSYKVIKKIIESDKFNILLDDYNKTEEQRNEIIRKIKNFHKNLIININNYTYFLMIKKIIKESLGFIEENNNLGNIKKDIEIAKKLLYYKESIKTDKHFLCPRKKNIRIKWITHLYYKDEIKNDIDKNIFITISSNGYICLFLFNIALSTLKNETSQYKKLLEQKIEAIKNHDNILKIKKCYDKKDVQENHYFLISSFVEEKALIIRVTEKTENPLEQRYQINEIETIDFERGLYSSIEFDYKGQYYLLNYHKSFELWYYNEIKNKFARKEIKVLDYIPDYNLGEKSVYGPLIQSQNKNLIIALVSFPIQRIEVYNFDELDNFICLRFKGFIKLAKDDNFINPCNNDYFLYKNRYLLLTSEVNKNLKEKGGIYVFDLDKLIQISLIEYKDIYRFNCLLGINDDTMICSIGLIPIQIKKNINNKDGGLILLKIEEKNGIINVRRIENKIYKGKCKFINCKDFIYESYFICSSLKENGVFRLNEKNEFVHYFNIYSA